MEKLTHVDEQGRANMVDVSGKFTQRRLAKATGTIFLSAETKELIHKNEINKGDVLTVAQIAGIQAAKQTTNLIPLCHPLQLDKVDVKLCLTESGVSAQSAGRCPRRCSVSRLARQPACPGR